MKIVALAGALSHTVPSKKPGAPGTRRFYPAKAVGTRVPGPATTVRPSAMKPFRPFNHQEGRGHHNGSAAQPALVRMVLRLSLVSIAAFSLVLALLAGSTAAGHSTTIDTFDPAPGDTLTLPVRVHQVTSDSSPELTSQLTEEEIATVFEGVNRVWGQARIVWEIESIVEEDLSHVGSLESLREGMGIGQAIAAVLPRENLTHDLWHVFFVRDMGAVPGFYASSLPAVIQSEIDPFGGVAFDGGLIRILSHELGHALGLQHVPCPPPGNLMAANCQRGDRTRLANFQIDDARAVAEQQRPYGSGFVTQVAFLLRHTDELELSSQQEDQMMAVHGELMRRLDPIIERGNAIVSEGMAEMASGSPDPVRSEQRQRELADLQSEAEELLQQSLMDVRDLLDDDQISVAERLLQAHTEMMQTQHSRSR